MPPLHVKTMAIVYQSIALNIIADALKNIMEETVNVSKVHTQAEITINQNVIIIIVLRESFIFTCRAHLNRNRSNRIGIGVI